MKEPISRKGPISARRSFLEDAYHRILVAGLGVTALTAALEAKEKGLIQGALKDWKKIPGLAGLEEGLAFLADPKASSLPEGKHLIHGEDIFATVTFPTTQPAQERKYEAHRKYIDIQYLVSGTEAIRVTSLDGLKIATPFDAQKDIAFFEHNQKFQTVALSAGRFVVFFPEDAHMPLCQVKGPAKLHKIVIKIAVDYLHSKQSAAKGSK